MIPKLQISDICTDAGTDSDDEIAFYLAASSRTVFAANFALSSVPSGLHPLQLLQTWKTRQSYLQSMQ